MKERLLQLLQERNLTNAKFAEIMETQPANITHIMNGRNKPGYDFIVKLVKKFPEINPVWLLAGRGDVYLEGRGTGHDGDFMKIDEGVERDLFAGQLAGGPVSMGKGIPRFGKKEPSQKNLASANITPATNRETVKNSPSQEYSGNGKRIEKIVVFYDDSTFQEYSPE